MEIEIKKLEGSMIEITGEIITGDFENERKDASQKLSQTVKIDGFRAGKIPEKILMEKIGEDVILQEMAQKSINKAYPKILNEYKIEAIGRPEIVITKIAKNNPLGFKIKTAVLPKIELPDWKEIAKNVMAKTSDVSAEGGSAFGGEDKEVDQQIENLRKMRAEKGEDGKSVLPELDNKFIKSLGNFKDMDDFRDKIRQGIELEKSNKEKEGKRMKVLEKISEKSKIDIPEVLIESEKDKMIAEMKGSITQMGMKWDEYLKHLKKSEEDLKGAWSADAKKRATQGLILRELAVSEKVEISKDELEKEVEKIFIHYKSQGQKVDSGRVRGYASGMLMNEKVFQMLESQKTKT